MDGKEGATGFVKKNLLRAVAVVNVEIKNGHALESGRARLQRGDGDGVEIAKAHRAVPAGVMARRAHQAEGHFAGAGRLQGLERAARGAPGVRGDLGIGRRVGVQVNGQIEPLQVFRGMGAEEAGVRDGQRFGPGQREGRLGFKARPGRRGCAGGFRDGRERSIRRNGCQ